MTTVSNDFRWTTIAHGRHHYLSPLSPAKAQGLIRDLAIDLRHGDMVLDAGCGKAGFLRDLLAISDATGVGVDINPEFIQAARALWAAEHEDAARLQLHEGPVLSHPLPEKGYDAIICLGSTHAFGSFDECLQTCLTWLRPGGKLLVADGYWKKVPERDYLTALDATIGEYRSHAETAQRAVDLGLRLMRTATSNEDEWDEFEGLYCSSVVRFVDANPVDADSESFERRIQGWHDTYLRWGRETLGFGFYLLAKPPSR